MGQDIESRLGVSWAQVAGSALAAVSSAILLSTLGVAGTVIGAAVGSVAATVSTAVYTRTLDVSRQQVAAQAAARRRVSRARSELDDAVEELAGTDPAAAPSRTAVAVLERDEGPDPSDVRRDGALSHVLARLSWRRLAVVAVAVFVGVMGAITVFELTTGQAVSAYTGGSDRQTGSTVPGLGVHDASTPRPADTATPDEPTESPDVAPSATPTEEPSGEPTGSPTTEPTDGATPTPTPTPSPSPDLTEAPSSLPSSTPAG